MVYVKYKYNLLKKLINELLKKIFNIIYDKIYYSDINQYRWTSLEANKQIANHTHFKTVGCRMKIEDLYNLYIYQYLMVLNFFIKIYQKYTHIILMKIKY